MNKAFKILVLMVVVNWFFGCEEETQWNLDTAEPIIIVDAIFTNEFKAHEVKIYSSHPNLNGTPEPITGATVKGGLSNIVYTFFESEEEPGTYFSPPFAIAFDQTYKLEIEYQGKKSEAFASGAYISELKKDTIYQNEEGLYKYVYTGSNTPAMTEVYYNWSHDANYCETYGSCYAAETFYTLNVIDIGQEFAPEKQSIYFPSGTTLTRRKYSLSDDHQEFIRSLLIETEWRGGLFDVEYGNVPTNFTNGVRGWFGICMVLEDTRVID